MSIGTLYLLIVDFTLILLSVQKRTIGISRDRPCLDSDYRPKHKNSNSAK